MIKNQEAFQLDLLRSHCLATRDLFPATTRRLRRRRKRYETAITMATTFKEPRQLSLQFLVNEELQTIFVHGVSLTGMVELAFRDCRVMFASPIAENGHMN